MDQNRSPFPAVTAAAVRAERFLERWPWVFPVALCLVLTAFGIGVAQRRLLWFDEIGTLLSIRSMQQKPILDYIRGGGDLAPPLYFVLGRGFAGLIGETPLLARYMAVAGTCIAVLALFALVRRWAGTVAACCAAGLLLHTAALPYVAEGRPYSVTVAACMVAALAWDFTAGSRRYLAIAAMALSASVALSLHYYAVFLLLPLGAGQLARDYLRRKLDIPVWCGILLPLGVLAAHIPLVRAGQAVYGKHAWQNLHPPPVPEVYRFLAYETDLLFFFLVLALWLASRWSDTPDSPATPVRIAPPVWVFLSAFLLIPLVAHTLGRMVGIMPVPRYLLFTVLGLAIFPVCFFLAWRPVRPWVRMALLLLVVLSLGRTLRNEYRQQVALPVSFPWLRENISPDSGPVLTTDAHLFLQLTYYRDAERLPVISFPDSLENSVRYLGEDSGIRNLAVYRNLFPEISLYRWERPAAGPWRYQSLRKRGRPAWEITEAFRLGGTVRLLHAGQDWELFAVEIPAL